MSNRTLSLSIAVAAVLTAPLAQADTDGFRWIGGEVGFVYEPANNATTRNEVKRELELAQRDGSWREQTREKNYLPAETPRAGFVSSRGETRQAGRLAGQAPNDGWRFVGGEAGWEYVGR
jgi:hypothetical protein